MNVIIKKRKIFIMALIFSIGIFAVGAISTNAAKESSYSSKLVNVNALLNSEDLKQDEDLSNVSEISVNNNQNVDITRGGNYRIRGNARESTINVDISKKDNITLILDGVNIDNKSFPAIYVKSAGKVSIITAGNSKNEFKVTGKFSDIENSEIDAVIFSNSDLVFKGTGRLIIASGEGNGVFSKNNLKVTGGTYAINSREHALSSENSVIISGGNFVINTAKDGIHSENSNDNSTGYVYISGGTFKIDAEDDGIQATTFAIIDGGEFSIDAAEGIEATHIQINDGDIDIQASDDGINAAEKSTAYKINLELNGGKINIVMAEGDTDAFDSNGNLTINGGNISIKANSAFDFDGNGQMNGGTVTVNGVRMTTLTNQVFPRGQRGRR